MIVSHGTAYSGFENILLAADLRYFAVVDCHACQCRGFEEGERVEVKTGFPEGNNLGFQALPVYADVPDAPQGAIAGRG